MKGRKLVGASVIDKSSGDVLGIVSDLILGHDLEVLGLQVESNKGVKCQLSLHDFLISDDVVTVSEPGSLKKIPRGKNLDNYRDQMGIPVLNGQGKEIGQMSDVLVEPDSRVTWGVEISHGLIKDFIDGRTEITMNRVRTVDEEALVVKEEGGMVD